MRLTLRGMRGMGVSEEGSEWRGCESLPTSSTSASSTHSTSFLSVLSLILFQCVIDEHFGLCGEEAGGVVRRFDQKNSVTTGGKTNGGGGRGGVGGVGRRDCVRVDSGWSDLEREIRRVM